MNHPGFLDTVDGSSVPAGVRLTVFAHAGLVVFCLSLPYGATEMLNLDMALPADLLTQFVRAVRQTLRASAWRNGSKSSRISLMSAVPVAVEPNGIGRYPQEIEAAVYFCTLEALNNVAK